MAVGIGAGGPHPIGLINTRSQATSSPEGRTFCIGLETQWSQVPWPSMNLGFGACGLSRASFGPQCNVGFVFGKHD